jgi:hypothetical protein
MKAFWSAREPARRLATIGETLEAASTSRTSPARLRQERRVTIITWRPATREALATRRQVDEFEVVEAASRSRARSARARRWPT